MSEEKRITIEDFVPFGFGFRVVWEAEDHWADVRAYEIIGTDEHGFALMARGDWECLPGDSTANYSEAEKYLSGFVKWDGCTELDMGQPHWCGPRDYKKHIALLEYIYRRAHELMGRDPEEEW